MDRIQAMAAFLTVVETGGFASAARKLNVSPSVITRAVVELEERLGVRLLTRTTRFVRVTEAGTSYADSCRRILADIEEAESAAAGTHAAPQGQLTVTSSVNFGRMYVSPIVRAYLEQFPKVDINCWFMDRMVNLVDEGVDVAVRIGELPDSSLQAVKVGQVRQVLCASPDYLRRRGIPERPEELTAHVMIAATGITPTPEWRFRDGDKPVLVRLQPRLTATTNEAAAESAAAGLGITRLPLYQIAQAVEDGTLELVLEAFERPAVPIHVVHREGRHATHKVRAFIDMAVDALRSDPRLR
ncbi:LysR family transcriptional regulator [Variovorax sp. IB41]|uniref:LysR family transcriptional regulator n=1 Tax=Variovorax sp. IB41 TaxID=2779370 RepID=UPI0018E8EC0C|nr:LysR family transcriptional regulator [Variovorax sp. IB41]MBJ2154283.1 LysR family transcriptional regulator [Variovorax sp. IB41]